MIKWIKPNDTEIKTADNKATIAYCEGLGWKRAEVSNKDAKDPTVDSVNKMKTAGLKNLIADYGLEIDTDLELADMRAAVVDALFEPE